MNEWKITCYGIIDGKWEKVKLSSKNNLSIPVLMSSKANSEVLRKRVATIMEEKFLKRPSAVVILADCDYSSNWKSNFMA